ncbi:hypothetical protein ES708_27798 [subsurface metagenome]
MTSMGQKSPIARMFATLGVRADDPEKLRLKKNLLVASSLSIGILALFWGILHREASGCQGNEVSVSHFYKQSRRVRLRFQKR